MSVENIVKGGLSLNNNSVLFFSLLYSQENQDLGRVKKFVQGHKAKNVSKPNLFNSKVLRFIPLYNINIFFHLTYDIGKNFFIEKSMNLKLYII